MVEAHTGSKVTAVITKATSSLDNTKIDTPGNIPVTMIVGKNDLFHTDQEQWYMEGHMGISTKFLIHDGNHYDVTMALKKPGLESGMEKAPKGAALTPPPQRKSPPQTVTPPKSTTPPPAEIFEEFSRKLSDATTIDIRSTLGLFDRNPSIKRPHNIRKEGPQSAWIVHATENSKDVSPEVLEARAITETLNQMLQEQLQQTESKS